MGYDNYAPCSKGLVTDTYSATEICISGFTYPGAKVEGLEPGRLRGEDGRVYKFVKAGEDLVAGNLVEYDITDATLTTVNKTEAVLDIAAGVAETAITSGRYGWITIAGGLESIATALVDGDVVDVAAGDMLAPSTTAGVLKKAAIGDRACAQAIEANAAAAALKKVRLLNGPLYVA